ncbi:MAG: large-conductance mechanosensitive channel protein MscL [Propionibacteriaceae bacterium]|jgi:large conductance mechanosensitive channel|nr:large-conductance mechanosensitive channel protein MscL [Propionibacteriaceae bacterium]
MLKGFKEFISRGNAIDLATGVIIGAAFTSVVNALVDKVLNPLIGAIGGKPNFDELWSITLNGATIQFGAVVTALINFLITAAVVYFCIVVPINKFFKKPKKEESTEEKELSDETKLLTEIRDLLANKS